MKKHISLLSFLLVLVIILGNFMDIVSANTKTGIKTKYINKTNMIETKVATGSVLSTTAPAISTPVPTKKPTPAATKKPQKKPVKKQVLTIKASQYGKTHVHLKWNRIKTANKYRIKITGAVKKTIKLGKYRKNCVFKISSGKKYYVRAMALKGKKIISKSKKITVCKPTIVSKVRYTKMSDSKVLITWKRGKYTKKFQVFRKNGSGKYVLIGTAKRSRFIDNKISPGRNYKYIIKSINTVSKTNYSSTNNGTCFTTKKIVNTSHQKYTYTEMSADIALLKRTYSGYVNIKTIGKSCDNRKIYDVIIGNTKSGRSIVVTGAIHAREYMTSQLCMAQLEYYLQNRNGKIDSISTAGVLNKIAIHYIPMVNPDGVTISQFGLSGIRNSTLRKALHKMKGVTAAKYWKSNARGVDLNKNFNYNYIAKYGGKRGSEGYTGESVNSEPETRAINALLDRLKAVGSIRGLINYHATGSIIFGEAKGSIKPVVNKMYELAKNITGYADSAGYEENVNKKSKKKNVGNLREYAMYKKNIPCITLEIGTKACPLSSGEFSAIWSKNKNLVFREAKLLI